MVGRLWRCRTDFARLAVVGEAAEGQDNAQSRVKKVQRPVAKKSGLGFGAQDRYQVRADFFCSSGCRYGRASYGWRRDGWFAAPGAPPAPAWEDVRGQRPDHATPVRSALVQLSEPGQTRVNVVLYHPLQHLQHHTMEFLYVKIIPQLLPCHFAQLQDLERADETAGGLRESQGRLRCYRFRGGAACPAESRALGGAEYVYPVLRSMSI